MIGTIPLNAFCDNIIVSSLELPEKFGMGPVIKF